MSLWLQHCSEVNKETQVLLNWIVAGPSAVWKSMRMKYSFYPLGEMGHIAMLHLN